MILLVPCLKLGKGESQCVKTAARVAAVLLLSVSQIGQYPIALIRAIIRLRKPEQATEVDE